MSLIVTPGASDANSYETVDEATAYWATRPHSEVWDNTDQDKEALLITATRMLDRLFYPTRKLMQDAKNPYYVVRSVWLGTPSSTAQSLAWPRTGMQSINGGAIPVDAIPNGLKDAVSELAGALALTDRLLDSEILAQGISNLRAGSVSLAFRGAGYQEKGLEMLKVLPDIIYELVVPWITDESMEHVFGIVFQVN